MGRGRKPKNAGVVAADIEAVEMKEGVVANPEEMPAADESGTVTSTKKKKTAADKEAGKVKKQAKAKAENSSEKKSTKKPSEKKSKAVKTDEEAEASALQSEKKEKKERKSKKSEASVKSAKTKETASKKKTNDDKEVKEKSTKTVKDKMSKKVNEKVIIQMPGSEQDTASIIERAVEQWVAGGHKKSEINSITLYVKPEEKKAYCVINVYDSVEIEL